MAALDLSAPASNDSLLGLQVIDKVGDPLGTVDALWSDHATGRLEFIGVKTGWLSGALHVIPAQGLEHDAARGAILLPYTPAQVRDAPSFEADATISDADAADIYRFYGLQDKSGVVPVEGASGETTLRPGTSASDPDRTDAADYTAGTGKGGYADTTAPAPAAPGRLRKIGPAPGNA